LDEHVASTVLLSNRDDAWYTWHPAEVHGRLGVVSACVSCRRTLDNIEVWVLEGGRRGWIRQYNVVQVHGVPERTIARPHFTHGGHVLLTDGKR
jgi:hypothetical protein